MVLTVRDPLESPRLSTTMQSIITGERGNQVLQLMLVVVEPVSQEDSHRAQSLASRMFSPQDSPA